MQNVQKFSALRAIWNILHTTVCKRLIIFLRFAPFAGCHENFIWCWHEKTGKKLAYFCFGRGKELELFTLRSVIICQVIILYLDVDVRITPYVQELISDLFTPYEDYFLRSPQTSPTIKSPCLLGTKEYTLPSINRVWLVSYC